MIQEANLLLKRFCSFFDGLIHSLEIQYEANGLRTFVVVVSGRDSADQFRAWRKVRICLYGVTEYRLYEGGNTTAQVITNGLHIMLTSDGVGIDLGDLTEQPDSIDELRESAMYAIGGSMDWSVCS